MLKALYVFYRTLYYLTISYKPGANILALKKQWADELLKFFGFEVEISGSPPTERPIILLGNHISYLDIIVAMSVHPEVVFLAKKEVGTWPIIGPTARRVNTLFVDRDSRDKDGVRRQIIEQLQKYQAQLVVFPSGTTTLDEEKPWKKGMFEIACGSGIKIQAFKVSYSHKRECAYIDDDHMLTQMQQLFKLKNKKAYFQWLSIFTVDDPLESAEKVRQHVIRANLSL